MKAYEPGQMVLWGVLVLRGRLLDRDGPCAGWVWRCKRRKLTEEVYIFTDKCQIRSSLREGASW